MKKYAPFVDWTGFHAPPNVNVEKTMNFSFALHDIGKPVSREFGGSHEEISAEILTRLMDRAGFTKSEVELGRAMINNDAIGKMLQGYLSPQEAYEQIVEAAKQTNLSPRDFFKIQSFYYTVDASAYPKLEASVFKTVNGMLVPKSPKYEVLKNLFENVGVDE